MKRLLPLALAPLLLACGTVDCGPCGFPVTLRLPGPDTVLAEELRGTACVDGWGCQRLEATGATLLGITPPEGLGAEDADGLAIRVEVRSRAGDVVRTGRGRFVFHDESGECACPTSVATVALDGG